VWRLLSAMPEMSQTGATQYGRGRPNFSHKMTNSENGMMIHCVGVLTE
jgi:hypothetical protein